MPEEETGIALGMIKNEQHLAGGFNLRKSLD